MWLSEREVLGEENSSLSVGLKTGVAAMEINVEDPQKAKSQTVLALAHRPEPEILWAATPWHSPEMAHNNYIT